VALFITSILWKHLFFPMRRFELVFDWLDAAALVALPLGVCVFGIGFTWIALATPRQNHQSADPNRVAE
jgi:hypothetical protein